MVNTKKLSSELESLHFPLFSAKCREFKNGERNGHGKVMDKYFVKSVGTLNNDRMLLLLDLLLLDNVNLNKRLENALAS